MSDNDAVMTVTHHELELPGPGEKIDNIRHNILGQKALKSQLQGQLASCPWLISEQIYGVLNFPNMQRNIARISALASKMGQIKKK